jgi:hypothetical protein
MPRHVAYIEAIGARTPERRERQRAIIAAAGREYRPLPDAPPHHDPSLIAGFAFSTRASAQDAIDRLVGILDGVDAEWRDFVRAWDGSDREDDAHPQLAEPPLTRWSTGSAIRGVPIIERLRSLLRR